MYIFDEMIDMGLRKGQGWPTDAHRVVAMNLALCNPLITTRDKLTDVVQKVRKIPKTKIKSVTLADLPDYGLGLIVSP